MARVYHLQDSFSAGQLSNEFLGRVDSVAYKTGLRECINAIPNSRGPVERRPGGKHLGRLTGVQAASTHDFVMDDEVSFQLVFYGTTLLVRDLTTRGAERVRGPQLYDSGGLSSWTTSGTVVQHAEYIEIPPGGYIEQVITMAGASTLLVDAVFTTSAVTLGTTVGASDVLNAAKISPEKYYSVGATRTGVTYLRIATDALATHPTLVYGVSLRDTISPAADHTEVTTYPSVEEIVVEMAPGNLSAYVLHPLVAPQVLTYDPTLKTWAWGAIVFTATPAEWVAGSYPSTMTLHQGRSWWSGVSGSPSMFWASKSGVYFDMTTGAVADDAMVYTLADRGIIRWMKSANDLLFGTDTGEFVVTPTDTPIIPGDIDVKRQSSYGSSSAEAMKFHEGVVFVSVNSKQIRFMQYTRDYLGWGSADSTYMNGDMVSPGMINLDQNKYTDTLVWVLLKNGNLVGYSFSKEVSRTGFYGWFSVLQTGYQVTSHVAIRNSGEENLYYTATVKINGAYETHIMSWDKDTEVYLDDYTEFVSNTATTNVATGLAHLEGETVSIWADHATQADKTVVGGAITLDTAANHVFIGKKYKTTLTMLPISYKDVKNETTGTRMVLRGKTIVKLRRSALPLVNGVVAPARVASTPMGVPEPMTSVDLDAQVLGWVRGGHVSITTEEPYPLVILSVASEAMAEAL